MGPEICTTICAASAPKGTEASEGEAFFRGRFTNPRGDARTRKPPVGWLFCFGAPAVDVEPRQGVDQNALRFGTPPWRRSCAVGHGMDGSHSGETATIPVGTPAKTAAWAVVSVSGPACLRLLRGMAGQAQRLVLPSAQCVGRMGWGQAGQVMETLLRSLPAWGRLGWREARSSANGHPARSLRRRQTGSPARWLSLL
jgi:hypothetical protein